MADNGVVDLYRFMLSTAHEKDVLNATQGIGMVGMLGTVVSGAPDIQIVMQGVINMTDDPMVLSFKDGDLLISGDLRLTTGDTVGLVPFRAARTRWWVMGVTRDPLLQPINETRLGYNGDRNLNDPTSKFAGLTVNVPDGDDGSTSQVTIQGQDIHITTFGGADIHEVGTTVTITGTAINITSVGGSGVTIDGINFKNHSHNYNPGPGGTTSTGGAH